MNRFTKVFVIMILIQIPIATIIDFGFMDKWGLSMSMLILAWIAVIAVNIVTYWIAVLITCKLEERMNVRP